MKVSLAHSVVNPKSLKRETLSIVTSIETCNATDQCASTFHCQHQCP